MLHVWWEGKDPGEGPLQLRLTGIDIGSASMVPSDAGPQEDPVLESINSGLKGCGVSKYRFRLNAAWSRKVWNRLCTRELRM